MIRTATRNGKLEREFYLDVAVPAGKVFAYTSVAVVPKDQLRRGDVLWAFAFHWDDGHYAIPFGDIALANHSDDPNTQVLRIGDRLCLHAVRDIAPGEKITHQYHKVWFEPWSRP